jgi:hypothetical protein
MSYSNDPSSSSWQSADTRILTALLALTVAWVAVKLHWSWTPMEDASMLLRYSQNLAAGHGVRWSLNQAPVDGATDFLYMALTAALSRLLHVGVMSASRWLNIAAQLGSVVLVYTGARRLGGHRWLSCSAALYLIAGPFVGLATACFGAPVFAFFVLAGWSMGLRYALLEASRRNAFAMATLGLLAGLTRPEGVLIAALLLVATLYLAKREEASGLEGGEVERAAVGARIHANLVVAHLLIFGIFGTAYFVWRWHYFGYPLPNPFYIKGDGHLYPSSVEHAAMNLVALLLPMLPLIPLGWLNGSTRRLTHALVFLLIGFALMWVLLSNQNNHFFRFQYALLPVVLMTVPTLANGIGAVMTIAPGRAQRFAVVFAAVLATLGSMLYIDRLFDYYNATEQGMRTFATRLQPLAGRGYTMAVTEAGALPLYSQWNTIDALGLNDTYIAHHHYVDRDYLDRTHPELIMVHIDSAFPGEFEPGGLMHLPTERNVFYNAEYLNYYAASHGYTLAAIWGSGPCNLHLYWLQPNIADYATVLSDIRDYPYYFLDNGDLAHDFRNEQDTLQACALPVTR